MTPHDRHIEAVLRETWRELEGRYDREAARLICAAGVLAANDPSQINQAVERLIDNEAEHRGTISALEDRAMSAKTAHDRQAALNKLEQCRGDLENQLVDAAYLLGIAVGRRLGPEALRPLPPAARSRRPETAPAPARTRPDNE